MADVARLQSLQNRCARLVTGTMFRSPTTPLLNDLGWERLTTRRLIHKLLFFHRLYYDHPLLPSYLTNILTDTRQDATGLRLRNANLLSTLPSRLTSFYRSYFPATIRQWNILPEELRNIQSRSNFARQVWQRFGAPESPPLHSFGTKIGNTHHTRLRIGLTTLNAHLFQIQHNNIPNPSCSCGHHHEDTNHYILWCPLHNAHRVDLFNAIRIIIPNFDNLSTTIKIRILLFGENVEKGQDTIIAYHLQTFIMRTSRFSSPT